MATGRDIAEGLLDGLDTILVTSNGRGQRKNVVDGLHAIASAINAQANATEEVAKAIRDSTREKP